MPTRQSFQTKSSGGFFRYNPFSGATILLYPTDRSPRDPRRFILQPDPLAPIAKAACGRVRVFVNAAGQTVCLVNGKPTERYSIIYPGRAKKRVFGKY